MLQKCIYATLYDHMLEELGKLLGKLTLLHIKTAEILISKQSMKIVFLQETGPS